MNVNDYKLHNITQILKENILEMALNSFKNNDKSKIK